MYFVNRSEIENLLQYFDAILQEVKENKGYSTKMEQLALERIVHVLIEVILDVGNRMIDGFIMRDPGSYEDIIDILVDERVLPEEDSGAYKMVIQARKMVVQQYATLSHPKLLEQLYPNLEVLHQFSRRIRLYLDNELGVANAFVNETNGNG